MSPDNAGAFLVLVLVALMVAAYWRQVLALIFALAVVGLCFGLYEMISMLQD